MRLRPRIPLLASFALFGLVIARPGVTIPATAQTRPEGSTTATQGPSGLFIENEPQLPDGYPRRHYEYQFRARGNVATLHWRVEKGALPPGMKLEDDGLLRGEPQHPGEFQFTVSVMEGSRKESAVERGFVLRVIAALAINWKALAHVNGNRIEGSVAVTNTSPDDMDLTFIVMAVAGNGRATAIGYQHFLLRRGTTEMELPFGETLPRGGYVVHVDAVGEVEAKNLIYRERMQTPGALQVNVGP
ncbi:MAG TPA: putative Ig domain-containing protein [Verrucomicrobiae bacterium]|nr:putative Ig domain-containing protein [Verrucomicrobiae bacterium]